MLKPHTASMLLPLLRFIQPLWVDPQIPSLAAVGKEAASDAELAARLESSSLQNKLVEKTYSLIAPRAGQFDLQISGLFGFTGPGSIVRVREFETEGTGLHFSSMDMNTEQMPTLNVRFWFNEPQRNSFPLPLLQYRWQQIFQHTHCPRYSSCNFRPR